MRHVRVYYLMFVLVAFLNTDSVRANNAAAGELSYIWLSGNTYRFVYKGYFDCSGSQAPASVYLCATNTCTNTNTHYILSSWTGSITYGRPNGSIVPVGCLQPKTLCENPSSSLRGFREYWYTADITLNDTCSNWQFVTTVNSRTNFDNVVAGNQYLRISFNNTSIQNNSTPTFTSPAIVYSSKYEQIDLNNHLHDPDGDSLVLELVQPFTHSGTSNLCPTTSSTVALVPHTPPFSFPTNPFPTIGNTSFYIDTLNGAHVVPNTDGVYLVTYLVKEYRNGQLIVTTLRDAIFVINGNRSYIRTELDTAGLYGLQHYYPGIYLSCPGDTIRMCYRFSNVDSHARIHVYDTLNNVIPGAAISYSGQGTDTVYACLEWVPSNSDTGTFPIKFMATDSTCYPPGLTDITWGFSKIYVRSQPLISINKHWPNPAWPYVEVNFSTTISPCNRPWYQWQVNGKDVPGVLARKHVWSSTNLNDGDNVRCLFKCYDTLCSDTSVVTSNTISMKIKTLVRNPDATDDWKVYPNPSNGLFRIKTNVTGNLNESSLVSITNIYGQMVHQARVKPGITEINLRNQPPGVYILKLNNEATRVMISR